MPDPMSGHGFVLFGLFWLGALYAIALVPWVSYLFFGFVGFVMLWIVGHIVWGIAVLFWEVSRYLLGYPSRVDDFL